MPYANDKGTDQPAHPRSLISTFVVRRLDSIIPLLTIAEISRPQLVEDRFSCQTPKDRFSCDKAHRKVNSVGVV